MVVARQILVVRWAATQLPPPGYAGLDLCGSGCPLQKLDGLHAEPIVYLEERGLQRVDLQLEEHRRRVLRVAERGALRRNDAEQLGRHTMRRHHVGLRRVLDPKELVFCARLGDRHDLDAALFAVRGMDEKVLKVARPLRLAQRFLQRIRIVAVDLAGRVEDVAGVAAVEVISAPKQRRRFIEQRGL